MIRNIVIIVLLLAGVSLIVYPWIDRSVQEHKQNRLLTEWRTWGAAEPLSATNAATGVAQSSTGEPIALSAERTETTQAPIMMDGYAMIGTISIPLLDAYEPILGVTTNKSLKIGIGNVVEGRLPGEKGNVVLAGHRSRTFGKQFSRLNELGTGDEIVVKASTGDYTYLVTETFLVEPDDISVLEQIDDRRMLTLITCHPVKHPTHRLIVRAEIK